MLAGELGQAVAADSPDAPVGHLGEACGGELAQQIVHAGWLGEVLEVNCPVDRVLREALAVLHEDDLVAVGDDPPFQIARILMLAVDVVVAEPSPSVQSVSITLGRGVWPEARAVL